MSSRSPRVELRTIPRTSRRPAGAATRAEASRSRSVDELGSAPGRARGDRRGVKVRWLAAAIVVALVAWLVVAAVAIELARVI